MPEIYVEFTDEDEDGTLAARNVQDEGKRSFIYFSLCPPDSLQSPDLPELCVEFTDEDEQTGIVTSDFFFTQY